MIRDRIQTQNRPRSCKVIRTPRKSYNLLSSDLTTIYNHLAAINSMLEYYRDNENNTEHILTASHSEWLNDCKEECDLVLYNLLQIQEKRK